MIQRVTGSIASLVVSFSIFLIADSIAESIADKISENFSAPLLANVANCISPIGVMMFILPIGIAVCFWFLSKEKEMNMSAIVWHFISILASLTFLSYDLIASGHPIYLDGHRTPTIGQLIGNVILSILVLSGIWFGFKKKPNQ